MGYMRHHAIIVTTKYGGREAIVPAHLKAIDLFDPRQVSEIAEAPVNGYYSFCIFPDGSKEGWDDSDTGDRARDAMVEWLVGQSLDWVEVQYADDNWLTEIVRSSQPKDDE